MSPHQSILIRPLVPADILAAKEVILQVVREFFCPNTSLEELRTAYEAKRIFSDIDDAVEGYDSGRGLFLVASDGEHVVGTGAVRHFDKEICELKRMWILPPYRRLGLGTSMTAQLLDFAKKRGYKRMRLDTSRKQTAAIAFYTKLGFRPIDRYNDGQCDLFMEKELVPHVCGSDLPPI